MVNMPQDNETPAFFNSNADFINHNQGDVAKKES
jgi:hypothetical protein